MLNCNIYVLVDGDQALLIDSGYEDHIKQVLENLDKKIVTVIPSHYHPDHVFGLRCLNQVNVYGNQFAVETLNYFEVKDVDKLSPTHIISSKDSINFGEFNINFRHLPGHSDCSMGIIINNKYIHSGDLYMTEVDGKDVLPFVKFPNIKEHIQSLDQIRSYDLLCSHGLHLINKEASQEGINNRIQYLNKLLSSNNTCTIEEALENINTTFTHLDWRQYV
jgi:glyoxylase-like metal-dependent hydrolase (beta-lactamase superfamily II)